jgi:acetolactate synthase-1/2/3 large subunit
MSEPDRTPSVAEAYLGLLKRRGIDWLFANAGTDFAPIIEALLRGRQAGLALPEAVPIAHENVAVGMAHGYYLITGRPQAVMVHVNVGTANALMGLINASRDRVPMLFTSGRTPITEQGRLGARDLPIHWGQEMFDQAGMLRELVKWDYELRYGDQLEAVVDRALAIAMTEPRGPVYLSLPREALAAAMPDAPAGPPRQRPASNAFPDPAAIEQAAAILAAAEQPLLIAGRSEARAFDVLPDFAERCAVPVVHFWPARLAMPTDHPLHAGFDVTPWIGQADAILVLDVLVPWLPQRHALRSGCQVIQIGPDPAFAAIPMRSFPGDVMIRAEVPAALERLAAALTGAPGPDLRRARLMAAIAAQREQEAAGAEMPPAMPMPPTWISRCIDQQKGADAILVNELGCLPGAMTFTHRDAYFGHPIAGGLGWGLPAALGAKLAAPERLVIACVGDGSYMFANPVACHQTAAALDLPVLTIVFDNEIWNAVRKTTKALYPDGLAAASNRMPLSSLAPAPAYDKVVEASGGLGLRVEAPAALPAALARAIEVVKGERRQALLNVRCAIDG